MKNKFVFDEGMSLDQILHEYEVAAHKCKLAELQFESGKEMVQSMYQALQEVTRFGNHTRIEKVIEGGSAGLKVVAVSKIERSWFSKLASSLGWK